VFQKSDSAQGTSGDPCALIADEIAVSSTSVNRYIDWNLFHRHRFSQKMPVIGQIASSG